MNTLNAPTARPGDGLGLLEGPAPVPASGALAWPVLVVDDDPEVHRVTRLAMNRFVCDGRPVRLISASSGREAREILQKEPHVALILLDVVMETDQAGLDVVRFVRETLSNRHVRIVLRTGQPGQAPARSVIDEFLIDGYVTKTELSAEKLYTVVATALRTYRLLTELEAQRSGLLRANHELERFAYIASHDLRTPLRTIVSFTQLLQRRCVAALDGESVSLVKEIETAGRRMHDLIDDLLEFTRLGREPAPPAPVQLDAVMERVVGRLSDLISIRHAQVSWKDLPEVPGNAEHLEQLFVNLVENGIKFQPGTAPVVELSAQRVGDDWEIRVADRGIGIDSHQLDRIFDPFTRLHTPDEFPGSGLGLAICRKVAQLHGGCVRAESAAGQGTRVIVILPA